MAAPLPFHFGAKFQYVFESSEIELRVFGEPAGASQALPVIFRSNIRGKMKLRGEQSDNLRFVGGIEQPALRFDDRGEQCDDLFAMRGCPGSLGEKASGLIRPNELGHGAESDEAFVPGDERNRGTEHRAGKFLVLAHSRETLRSSTEGFDLV